MTVSLKHAFQSAKPDGADTSIVRPSDWNAEHVLTQATNKLLGRTSAGTGATEEITAGSGLTLGSGTLSADVTSVAGRTGAVTLGISDVASLQTSLDAKAPLASPTFTGTVTLPSGTSIGSVTSTELGYLSGVTSSIQTQISAKLSTSATTYVQQSGTTGAAYLPAGSTAQRPGTPAAGYIRYNSSTGKFEGYGSAWGNIGGGAAIGDTPPSNPGAGDLWWNSADGRMYVYYTDANSSQWVDLSAGGAGQYLPLTGGTVSGNFEYTGTLTGGTGVINIGSGQFYKAASGNIGIGTSSPAVRLHAYSSDAETILRLEPGQTGARAWDIISASGPTGVGQGALSFYDRTSNAERARLDNSGNFLFNSGIGSARIAYGVRAWVNFSSVGGISIRASGNVSSISDDGSSHFISYSNAMPDANAVGFATAESGNTNAAYEVGGGSSGGMRIWHTASDNDVNQINFCIVR